MITPHGPIDAGEIADDTITDSMINSAATILFGDAAGYKVARGTEAVTGTADVDTGLTTVVSVVASLGEDPNADAHAVTAAIGGVGGHADLKVWKLADGTPNTLVASDAAKDVNWIAVGT